MLHIILHHPEIPPNTGNVARLCACNDLQLHLIEPLGFSLEQKHLRRAGLDYWPHVRLTVHSSWEAFLEAGPVPPGRLLYFSAKARRSLWDMRFSAGDGLVFGSESCGLPEAMVASGQACRIPMVGSGARCLNLSSAVAAATYEALRQVEAA